MQRAYHWWAGDLGKVTKILEASIFSTETRGWDWMMSEVPKILIQCCTQIQLRPLPAQPEASSTKPSFSSYSPNPGTCRFSFYPHWQDRLHNLWGLVQKENARHLVQILIRIQDGESRACLRSTGPSKCGTLCDCPDYMSMKPPLLPGLWVWKLSSDTDYPKWQICKYYILMMEYL